MLRRQSVSSFIFCCDWSLDDEQRCFGDIWVFDDLYDRKPVFMSKFGDLENHILAFLYNFFYYDYLYSRFTYLYFVISLNFLDNFFLAHNHSCLFFTHSTKYYFSSLLKIFMNRSLLLLSRSVYMSLSSCNDIDASMLDIITPTVTLQKVRHWWSTLFCC